MTKSNDSAVSDSRKYAPFSLTFRDPWEDADVEMNFRFAKPTKTQIKRLTDTAGRNPMQASRDLLLGAIHPEDKEELLAKLEDYPGIATSYSTALIKAVGIGTDLGN
jgi:hypothetical protein